MNENTDANSEDLGSVQGMEQLFHRFEQYVFELLEIQRALSRDSADRIELLERFHSLSKEGEDLINQFEKATDIAPSKSVDPGTVSLAQAFIRQLKIRLAATNEMYSKLKIKPQ